MKYWTRRIDLSIAREIPRPFFHLPSVTADLFDHLFQRLRPRFSLSLSDAKSLGGTSYDDVKLVLTAFAGSGVFEVTPIGLSCRFVNLITTDEDVRTLLDFTAICESVVADVLKGADIKHRAFRAKVWLECDLDGGVEAIDKMLLERGSRALDLTKSEAFKDFEQRYTIRVDCKGPKGDLTANYVVQRSEIQPWHLFVDGGIGFTDTHPVQGLQEQFDYGRTLFQAVLTQLGLEPAT